MRCQASPITFIMTSYVKNTIEKHQRTFLRQKREDNCLEYHEYLILTNAIICLNTVISTYTIHQMIK